MDVLPSDGQGTIDRTDPQEELPMPVEFYSVKHKRKVQVDDSEIQKKTFERETSKGTQTRYALAAETTVDGDRVKLTKFVSKDDYDRF
jgi:hypothetical protein